VSADALAALESFRSAWADKLPAGTRFGVGFKQAAGDFLDQIALIVFLPEKLPPDQLPADGVIPATWQDGGAEFPTDVVQSNPEPISLLNDNGFYPLILGGIEIGWQEPPGGVVVTVHRGTLGCIVQRRSDGARQYLTAGHVAPTISLDVAQPAPGEPQSSLIGSVAALGTPWDCAAIDPNGSRGEPLIGVQDIGTVAGSAAFQLWSAANKRGRTTGLTSGLIVAYVPDPGGVGIERIRIATFPFGGLYCWYGDSGSAILDTNNEVLGLLVEMDEQETDAGGNPTKSVGLAIPIQRVLDALQVEVATPPTVTSVDPDTAVGVLANGGLTQIDGSGFDAGSQVTFIGVPALTITPASPLRLIVTPPPQAPGTSGDVIVTNSHGDSSVSNPQAQFSY
jgi:hypothetical protein